LAAARNAGPWLISSRRFASRNAGLVARAPPAVKSGSRRRGRSVHTSFITVNVD